MSKKYRVAIFIVEQSLIKTITALWQYLPDSRRRQFKLLLLLTALCAATEVVSLGAVIPFIAVITQPDKVMDYYLVSRLADMLAITAGEELILPLSVAFGFAAVLSGVLRLSLVWCVIQVGNGCGADLSVDLYRRTLCQPYAVHISRNSSEIISSVTQKVGAVTSVLNSVLIFITSLFLFFSIVATLIVVDSFTAITCALCFGIAYAIIGWIAKSRLAVNSKTIAHQQSKVVKSLQEGLGSIRDVLLDGSQKVHVQTYSESVNSLRQGHCQNAFINQFPRYAMESIGLVLIATYVVFLSRGESEISEALTILAVLALGAQRLLPISQQIYGNWSVIVSNKAALLDVMALLEQPFLPSSGEDCHEPLILNTAISFSDVSFQYDKDNPLVLNGIDLVIPKGSRVGIIGGSGCGKSTFLDLLMGLLNPSSGVISVDEIAIDTEKKRSSWQRSIAHVPQSIYLADCPIGENIAFGVPPDKIDFERVQKAARRAEIAEYIENGSGGYGAPVGERGVWLSGGQQQRIGIARALYKDASVIIFDEATSALDNRTESTLMNTIEGLSREVTMFIVAHRLTSLKNCDFLIKLDGGKVSGPYQYSEIINLEEGG